MSKGISFRDEEIFNRSKSNDTSTIVLGKKTGVSVYSLRLFAEGNISNDNMLVLHNTNITKPQCERVYECFSKIKNYISFHKLPMLDSENIVDTKELYEEFYEEFKNFIR